MEDNKETRQLNSHENSLFVLVLDLARVVLQLKSAISRISYSGDAPNWKAEVRTMVEEADIMFDDVLKSIDVVRGKK